jgi:hypothetical protein
MADLNFDKIFDEHIDRIKETAKDTIAKLDLEKDIILYANADHQWQASMKRDFYLNYPNDERLKKIQEIYTPQLKEEFKKISKNDVIIEKLAPALTRFSFQKYIGELYLFSRSVFKLQKKNEVKHVTPLPLEGCVMHMECVEDYLLDREYDFLRVAKYLTPEDFIRQFEIVFQANFISLTTLLKMDTNFNSAFNLHLYSECIVKESLNSLIYQCSIEKKSAEELRKKWDDYYGGYQFKES